MNGLSVFFRFLRRNYTLTIINLVGLSLGISSCIFISIFVIDELSFDDTNVHSHRIYRLSTELVSESSVDHVPLTSSPLADLINREFKGVERAVRFEVTQSDVTVSIGDRIFRQEEVHKADSDVFKVFSYHMIAGDPAHALDKPNQVVLTKSLAVQYFGSTDVLGKMFRINKKDQLVTGVMDDVPMNSDLRFKMLMSMDSTDATDDWYNFSYQTFVMFEDGALSAADFLPAFDKHLAKIADEELDAPMKRENIPMSIKLHKQRLKGLHFEVPLLYDTPKGNIYYTYVFSAVAVLILLIACLNFVNFSIVQSIERSKEVGIRKVVGATFQQLVRRYAGESFAFTLIALFVALLMVVALLPYFNTLTDRNFSIAAIADTRVIGASLVIVLLVGILAGSYPAFYTSSVKPVQALKGKITTPKGQLIRKISIGSQFFISIGLIICTVIVYGQMQFVRSYDLGFDRENIVVVDASSDSVSQGRIKNFVRDLRQSPWVKDVVLSGYGGIPTGGENSAQRGTATFKSEGKDEVRMVNNTYIDENYLPGLGLSLSVGRNFDGSLSDFSNSVLVNESLVKMMGWTNPLEQQVMWGGKACNIIGVVRDFHYMSLYFDVQPQLFVYHKYVVVHAMVKLKAGNPREGLAAAEQLFRQHYKDDPFNYRFMDEMIGKQYQREDKAMTVFSYFSLLTVSISCLGLFGLSSLNIYQRKKEIGIRRIIGANYATIIAMFAKEYLVLISIAMIIVTPLVWFGMNEWLATFPLRQTMGIGIYVLSGVIVLLISFLTVLFSLHKIARTQPVNLIRED